MPRAPNLRWTPAILAIALLSPALMPASVEAQDEDPAADPCTYETCALRLKHRFFGPPRIVQGTREERIAAIGFFPRRLSLFGERSDTAAVLYDRFRTARTRATLLGLFGGLALAAGGAAIAQNDDVEPVAAVAILIGFGLEIGSDVIRVRAGNHLSSAIWWYNRTLRGRPEEHRRPAEEPPPR